MKYNFSTHFLKILPPDTNFGRAWESLCFDLLRAELHASSLIRFNPPDNGIDFFHRELKKAYQCKSDERGAAGSISAGDSISSLKTALEKRGALNWKSYCFCTNANYNGNSIVKIEEEADQNGLIKSELEFLGPAYWDELCSKHFPIVQNRLDYRISVTEEQVLEAFKKASDYDKYIKEYESLIKKSNYTLVIKNNRTPIELEIPFSPDLSVENCLDVTKTLLGISLEWTNFSDIGTSAGPSLSLTINRYAQDFPKKIKELELKEGENIELWIQIIWEDKKKEKAVESQKMFLRKSNFVEHFEGDLFKKKSREFTTYEERRNNTLARSEELIQSAIWENCLKLKNA